MDIDIIFGRIGTYKKDNRTFYTIDYLNDKGYAHHHCITEKLYKKITEANMQTGSFVTASFVVDNNNKLSLIDLNI